MSAVQYVGDDGTTYQIEQPSAYSAPGAGSLPAASGSEPLFAALYTPRYVLAFSISSPLAPRVHVVCDSGNPIFTGGPGTTFSISGIGYKVEECVGERRPLL